MILIFFYLVDDLNLHMKGWRFDFSWKHRRFRYGFYSTPNILFAGFHTHWENIGSIVLNWFRSKRQANAGSGRLNVKAAEIHFPAALQPGLICSVGLFNAHPPTGFWCVCVFRMRRSTLHVCVAVRVILLAVIVPCGCFHCNDALIYTSKKFFVFFLHFQTFQLLMSYLCLGFFSDIVLLFLLLLFLFLLFLKKIFLFVLLWLQLFKLGTKLSVIFCWEKYSFHSDSKKEGKKKSFQTSRSMHANCVPYLN